MADYWVEVHCDGRHKNSLCHSNHSGSPGIMVRAGQLAAAGSMLRIQSIGNGWKFPHGKAICPSCHKALAPKEKGNG